ncbi:MAG: winged helix-turn-helix domain-containing protein, partial [Methylococcales bacterium]
VIVLSVRSGEAEKVKALDAGANDYVTKPFGVQELSARLRALLRLKPEEDQAAIFDDGVLKIDLARRQITRHGEMVALSRKEWSLLNLLMRHSGRVVTQPQLLRELWGPSHEEDTHYLRILVAKLRTKLGDDAAAPRYIQTEAGVGLRFISDAAFDK